MQGRGIGASLVRLAMHLFDNRHGVWTGCGRVAAGRAAHLEVGRPAALHVQLLQGGLVHGVGIGQLGGRGVGLGLRGQGHREQEQYGS